MKHASWWIGSLITVLGLTGCSYPYRQGLELERQQRWEEAAVEFRTAYVDSPTDSDIQAALERVTPRVAEEYWNQYEEFLQRKEFFKAFRRLEATSSLTPEDPKVQAELKRWSKVLVTGQIDLQVESLRRNVRLADEMRLQVHLNSPSGQTLTTDMNREGFFFVEDVLYDLPVEAIATYTLNAIGLNLRQGTSQGYVRKEFDAFISFRDPQPLQLSGRLGAAGTTPTPIAAQPVDPGVLQRDPWVPPRVLSYTLTFEDTDIRVGESPRLEYLPQQFYFNQVQNRACVDFGVYSVAQQEGQWSIVRHTGGNAPLQRALENYALLPYLSYTSRYPYQR